MPNKYRMVYAKGEPHPNREDARLYRIVALREGPWGPKGTKGGFIEKAANLSQDGDCWVANGSFACNDAQVSGDARVATLQAYSMKQPLPIMP